MFIWIIIILHLMCLHGSHGSNYCGPGAVIGNDRIILGVDHFGALCTPYISVLGLPQTNPIPGPGHAHPFIGIRSRDIVLEGGYLEGWGVGIPSYNISAGTGLGFGYGVFQGLSVITFTGTNGDDNALSHVRNVAGPFEVIHNFYPDVDSEFAMKIEVTITNTSPNNWPSVLYRRAMHTDTITTDGNHQSTILTMQGTNTPSVVATSTNPWQGTNPLYHDPVPNPPGRTCNIPAVPNQDFTQLGPCYWGFAADFEVGPLNSGESVTFTLWYGGAADPQTVQDELSTLGGGTGPDFFVFVEREGFNYTFFFAYQAAEKDPTDSSEDSSDDDDDDDDDGGSSSGSEDAAALFQENKQLGDNNNDGNVVSNNDGTTTSVISLHFSNGTLMNFWILFGILIVINIICCWMCNKKKIGVHKVVEESSTMDNVPI